jgi:hypothetical protein
MCMNSSPDPDYCTVFYFLLFHQPEDNAEAAHWYTLCKKFNPTVMDCSAALVDLYLTLGRVDKAKEEFLNIVTSPANKDLFAAPLSEGGCVTALSAIDVLDAQTTFEGASMAPGPAKYLLMLVSTEHR